MKLAALLLLATLTASAQTRTVTDEKGRQVTLPTHPHRIICLVPSITDDAFALGAADDIVAVSDYVKYPAEATKKPSVGSILHPSIEAIVALHPDLILAEPIQNGQATLDQFARLNIPVYLVDTHGIHGILTSLTHLGDALNRQPQAAAVVAQLQSRIRKVQASVQGKPIIPVFMPVTYDPVITIGRGAFITDIITLAGGRSITDDLPQEWPRISMEVVIERAPQALLLTRGGHVTLDVLKTRPGWNTLAAVRDNHVYTVDRRVEFSSPVAIDALEDLARQFHP